MFVPHFYAQIAALNQSVVVGDSILAGLSPLLEYHHFVWILPVLLLQLRRHRARLFTPLLVVLTFGWGLLMASFDISFVMSSNTYWWHVPGAISYLLILGGTLTALHRPELEPDDTATVSATPPGCSADQVASVRECGG